MTTRIAPILLACLFMFAASPGECASGESAGMKAVLVTGASSGIGRKITEALAAHGYYVYAGARKPQDLEALDAIDNVQSVRLDVTVQEEIDAAVEHINAEGRGLYALVNNAGVLFTGPAMEVDVERVRSLFDVNVFGVFRVTQAFTPLIIESKGRILNVGSVAGNIGIRFLGPYSMSKHALEAYNDALAAELEPLGVAVSIIAPGDYASNIWSRDISLAREAGVVADGSPYADDYRAWMDFVASLELKQPDEVADKAVDILGSAKPRRRYLIVPNADEMAWVMGSAVRRLAELNTDHTYSYSPAELTRMLQQAISEVEANGD